MRNWNYKQGNKRCRECYCFLSKKNWHKRQQQRGDLLCHDCYKAWLKDYHESNKETRLEKQRKYRRENNKHVNQLVRESRKGNPKVKLARSVYRLVLYEFGRRNLDGVWKYLPYTSPQLWEYLEATIPAGYTIQDWIDGTLQLDHIKERKDFTFNKPTDQGFQDCWAMSNLRLLPKHINAARPNKVKA